MYLGKSINEAYRRLRESSNHVQACYKNTENLNAYRKKLLDEGIPWAEANERADRMYPRPKPPKHWEEDY